MVGDPAPPSPRDFVMFRFVLVKRAAMGLGALSLIGALSLSASASAASKKDPEPGDVFERPRIFFDAQMLYWQATLLSPGSAQGAWARRESLGVLGYRRVPIGIGAGYAVRKHVMLGARIDTAVEPRGGGIVGVRGELSPYVEFLFAREQAVRPFAIIRGGLGRSHAFRRNDEEEAIEAVGPMTWYPTLGLGVGAHAFITDVVSFDAMLTLDHRWNFERPLAGGDAEVSEEGVTPTSWYYRDGTLSTALTFGFSSWF